MGESSPLGRVRATGVAVYLGLAGLVASLVWTYAIRAVAAGAGLRPGPIGGQLAGAVALLLGTVTVGSGYLLATGRGRGYLDVAVPGRRGLGYAVAGLVALFALVGAVEVLHATTGLRTAEHGYREAAREGSAALLLAMIPAAVLLIGPGEELLYRNVVQKSLYDAFPRWRAIVVASGVFALVHLPAYAAGAERASAVAVTLTVVFLLSLVLGAVYERTGNVVVPALVHGAYDAITFALLYVELA